MYRIAEISPSDIKPRERLRGVISKVTGREIRPDRDIFSRVTRAEGSEIIEMLKRILRSEQNKLKRSDKHGTCNAGKDLRSSNRFTQFAQNSYDFAALEKEILSN